MLVGSERMDLKLTLVDSAQCFHWHSLDGGYAAVINGGCAYLRQTEEGLCAEGDMDAGALRRYLDLDRDYAAIAGEYACIPMAQRSIALYPGLRVLNQPTWEALIAFILSANNNVARIRKLVEALCRALGPERTCREEKLYGFPTPETLADCGEARLRALGVGYRAPFLIGTARRVAEGFSLDALARMDYESAHCALLSLPGVGDKVADCVLLFGCGQTSAFPVDVWVERLLRSWFGVDCAGRRQMAALARERLGEHAGLLQQFLFHAARMGDIEL